MPRVARRSADRQPRSVRRAGRESCPSDPRRHGPAAILNLNDLAATEAAIKKGLETPGPYVLIDKNPCILRYRVKKPTVTVNQDTCTGCRACLKAACVALGLTASGDKPKVRIDPNICNGCGVCSQLCKFDAMSEA